MLGGNASHVILFSSNKKRLLLTKRRDLPTWVLPGGHLEQNETFESAAARECKEETGLTIKLTNLVAIYKNQKNTIEKRIYTGEVTSGKILLSSETKQIKWFSTSSLPPFMTQYERERIQDSILYKGITIKKPLIFNWKKELLFQLKNPIRFFIFLSSFIRNNAISRK